jgi:hypothetical protein
MPALFRFLLFVGRSSFHVAQARSSKINTGQKRVSPGEPGLTTTCLEDYQAALN